TQLDRGGHGQKPGAKCGLLSRRLCDDREGSSGGPARPLGITGSRSLLAGSGWRDLSAARRIASPSAEPTEERLLPSRHTWGLQAPFLRAALAAGARMAHDCRSSYPPGRKPDLG